MSEVLERTTELPLDTAAKRVLIESELRRDAGRSDREIARIVGVDHKTVGAARERLGIVSPSLGNSPPTATDRRNMLINACEAFDAKNPPEIAENVVDRMIAEGKIGDAVAARPNLTVKAVVAEPEENHFLPESESLVLPSQPAIAVYTNRYGQVVIRQEETFGDDGDHFVYICPQHLDALIVRLRKFLP
jgi:hypothetical protein